jgi:hypothetical protein
LVWYGNGAAFVESFVNYPSWQLIGGEDFVPYHQFISPRVIGLLVAPALLGTVLTIALIWVRSPAIPAWMVWLAVLAQVVLWISTATIQVPIQLELSERGYSRELAEHLIITNFWLRRIPYAICAGLFVWMAVKLLSAGGAKGK